MILTLYKAYRKCSLYDHISIEFFNSYFHCASAFNPSLTAEISQSQGETLIGAHCTLPRCGYRRNRNHMPSYREPIRFVFHHVPVSSQHCKRAQRDLSTSVKKCSHEKEASASLSLAEKLESCTHLQH